MLKRVEISILVLLFIFVFYCALIIGSSWDEPVEITRGNERLKYLFSFGSLENYWGNQVDEFMPGFYSTLASFITKMFPKKYEIETLHLTNLLFSIFTIFGISKISSELFDKKVGKIVFILCFLNPIFFGHTAINQKDMIVAFSNIWVTYLIIRYLRNQQISDKRNRYVIFAGLATGLGLGVRIVFLSSLLPIIIISILGIFLLKKIINKNFSYKKLIIESILFELFII